MTLSKLPAVTLQLNSSKRTSRHSAYAGLLRPSPVPLRRTRFCLQSHEGFLVDLADSQVDASTSIWTENPAEALQFVTYSKAVGSALLLKEAHPDLLVSSVVFQLEANSHDWVSAK